jgi:hypothetical protein
MVMDVLSIEIHKIAGFREAHTLQVQRAGDSILHSRASNVVSSVRFAADLRHGNGDGCDTVNCGSHADGVQIFNTAMTSRRTTTISFANNVLVSLPLS